MLKLKLFLSCPVEGLTGTPLTTSARISALNIVGELLRKVGVSPAVTEHLYHQIMHTLSGEMGL